MFDHDAGVELLPTAHGNSGGAREQEYDSNRELDKEFELDPSCIVNSTICE